MGTWTIAIQKDLLPQNSRETLRELALPGFRWRPSALARTAMSGKFGGMRIGSRRIAVQGIPRHGIDCLARRNSTVAQILRNRQFHSYIIEDPPKRLFFARAQPIVEPARESHTAPFQLHEMVTACG